LNDFLKIRKEGEPGENKTMKDRENGKQGR
jgi:hypothetical protein